MVNGGRRYRPRGENRKPALVSGVAVFALVLSGFVTTDQGASAAPVPTLSTVTSTPMGGADPIANAVPLSERATAQQARHVWAATASDGQTKEEEGGADVEGALAPSPPGGRFQHAGHEPPALTAAAQGATVYEIEGEWDLGTPASLRDGDTATVTWRLNVNDDGAAPGNEPVDNVTFTVTLANSEFSAIPQACLVDGVDPISSISPDGTILTCNLGTRQQGSAFVTSTDIIARGNTGDLVGAQADVGGATADIVAIPIDNPFGMDIRWANAVSGTSYSSGQRDIRFQWTLFHNRGAEAGPNTITYDITVSNSVSAGVEVGPGACRAFSTGIATGHPWSGGTHPSHQMAPLVDDCTLTRISGAGSGSATFRLTLTGIDYSQLQVPTHDSGGNTLPTSTVAVATGEIQIRLLSNEGSGQITATSNAPTYVAPGSGATVADDPGNNSVTTNFLSGVFWGAWLPRHTGSSAQEWTASYQAPVGETVRQGASYTYANYSGSSTWRRGGLCVILDHKYVEFVDAFTTLDSTGASTDNGDPIPGAVLWYYTGNGSGNNMNPNHTNYNPNDWEGCHSSGAGWTTTKPADSDIRAVRANYIVDEALRADRARLWVDTQIKTDTPIGQDVWTWVAYANRTSNNDSWNDSHWSYPRRSMTASEVPVAGTLTPPEARYPFAAAMRDVLFTVGTQPQLSKTADPQVVDPGGSVLYALTYSADVVPGVIDFVDSYQIVDRLPAEVTYIPGSASPEPVLTTEGGIQVLTWTFDGVAVNTDHTLTYQTRVSESVAPGSAFVNRAVASVDGLTTPQATARVTTTSDGWTRLSKSAGGQFIPNVDGDGTGTGYWAVRVSSEDPVVQEFTDVIDVLPYVGDGRGTAFASGGSYELSGPVTASGPATIWYATADPASIPADPADPANGVAGDPSGSTVGWSTTFDSGATAVRVIGEQLAFGEYLEVTIPFQVAGFDPGDVLVNRAEARAANTRLIKLTSASITMSSYYSATLKKYVQDPEDAETWHDANDPAEYPAYRIGDDVTYRVVVENIGLGALSDIEVNDDQEPVLGSFTIDELLPGAANAYVHEYTITLGADTGGTLVNVASATVDEPEDAPGPVTIPDDPAGVEIINYSVVKTSDPGSGNVVRPGDIVYYTVTVSGEGSVPVDAWLRDNLDDVLDDATYNGDASATVGTVSVTGEILEWAGTLPPGGEAIITYSVTVNDAGDLDEGYLRNVVFSPGCIDPEDCFTEHPVDPGPVGVFLLKQGLNTNGEVVPMDGSQWEIRTDEAGAPGAVPAEVSVDLIDPASVGRFEILGLGRGQSYWLVETVAPEGFNLLAEPVLLQIDADGVLTLGQGATAGVVDLSFDADTATYLITVTDVPRFDIPEAGGPGTQHFALWGMLLLVCAAGGGLARRNTHTACGRTQVS